MKVNVFSIVCKVLRCNDPLTVREIAHRADLRIEKVFNAVDLLLEQGNVVKIHEDGQPPKFMWDPE